jgi:hypothetical protein
MIGDTGDLRDTGELAKRMVEQMDALEALADAVGLPKGTSTTELAQAAVTKIENMTQALQLTDFIISSAAQSLVMWVGTDRLGLKVINPFPGLETMMELDLVEKVGPKADPEEEDDSET